MISPPSTLTRNDLLFLTLFKWRYQLQTDGFTRHEAEQLLFLKWCCNRSGGCRRLPAPQAGGCVPRT